MKLKSIALLLAGTVGVTAVAVLALVAILDLVNPFDTDRVDRSQPPLLESIEDVSEYRAAVGNFQVLVDVEDDVNWVPSFLAGERSLFVATGTVDAYVDFSGLSKDDVVLSKDGTKATIRLPEAELDEPNLDQEETYLYDQDRGLVNRVQDAMSTDDQSEIYQLAEDKIRTAADASELRAQARENTETFLIGLGKSLGVEITIAA
ncbi:hypothetical protein ASG76_11525 [Nocardioides sp. Soil774]|uniref:DUF4230 domain-containing protein n=1 Tax=Nocardioides sp. Soil774 TaxID=1736408 RepID=UPI0006FE91E3|nr:DUF4230 domain-containing protein [Nocardioides sp. Soil774]KRE94030.1 hypothetical protein ASG76_11525 [Nocardioides sp. Soil774]